MVPQKSREGRTRYRRKKLVISCRKVGTTTGHPALFSSFPSSCISALSDGVEAAAAADRRDGFRLSGFSLSDVALDESSLDGSHLVVKCLLSDNGKEIETHAPIDCGTSGFAFTDEDFERQHHLPQFLLRVPRDLEVIDGRSMRIVKVRLDIGDREELPAFAMISNAVSFQSPVYVYIGGIWRSQPHPVPELDPRSATYRATPGESTTVRPITV